jgi:predicted Zn-dependent peptidase
VLVKFRDTYFVANNMVVAVVGNVRHEDVFNQVGVAFADMPTGSQPRFHPAPPPVAQARLVEGSATGNQARIAMGVPAPGSNNDERYALDVLVAVLGEAGRRLHNEVVEDRGLASSIGVAFWELTDVGVWQIWAGAGPENIQPLIDIVKDQVRVLRSTPLGEAELDEAKAYIRGSSRLGLESNISQAQRLADGVALGRYEPLEQYLSRVQAITAEDVRAVARKYLDPDAMTIVVLKPSE